jgi:UDP-N-acetyl-D-mannosaminuronate dehydrogenase
MQNSYDKELLEKIEQRKIVAGVVGLGYVGLPTKWQRDDV